MRRLSIQSRWLTLAIGVAAVIAGLGLTLRPYRSLDALTFFIAASFVLVGIGDLLQRRGERSSRWLAWMSGAVLIATGLAALALRDQTIRLVAIAVGVGLIVSGVARLWPTVRALTSERYAAIVGGLGAVIAGVLALLWRDVTILIVALFTGPIAIIFGIQQVLRALRWRDDEPDEAQPDARRNSRGRIWRSVRATAVLLLMLGLLAVSSLLHRGTPKLDAFYDTPANLPATPGQLLRREPFSRAMPDGSQAERILYTTTALDGTITTASALVIVPESAPTDPWPVILWAHGTTGIARQCAPSNLADPLGAGAMPAQQEAIDQGWAIVAPDYLGLGGEGPHPYLVGAPVAQSSLDAVRAARQMNDLALSEKTVAWGHSQGGAVALWIGIESATYAPDVPLDGIVAMAPASNLPAVAGATEPNRIAQLFGVFIIEAYARVYADVHAADYVRPAARAVVESVAERCLSEPATLVSVGAIISGEPLNSRPLMDGPLGERLIENVPDEPTGLPTMLAQGLSDSIILPASQAEFVTEMCAAGQVIESYTYAGRDHLGVVADDSPLIPDLLSWTANRFAGAPGATSCLTTER